jgi:hypothetical protein
VTGKTPAASTRVCQKTGLVLVKAKEAASWRIAKTSYGAMNPLVRETGEDRAGWGRYDVLNHRTIYAARPEDAAYAESLAFARPALGQITMGDLFSSMSAPSRKLMDVVAEEWAERGHMAPGTLPAGWRLDRLIHRIDLDQSGWFIDVESSDSVATIREQLAQTWVAMGLEEFTVAALKGENRAVTTAVADWLWHQVLDDGSLPLGVQFRSKHGSNWRCWAAWLRQTDDGYPEREETTADAGSEIKLPDHNPPLAHVATMFGIKCF